MSVLTDNKLEAALHFVRDNPAQEKPFWHTLLESDVFVLGSLEEAGAGMVAIQNGLASYGTSAIPFFSSYEVLEQSVDASRSYLTMPAKTLFELTLGAHYVLNPRSENRREFSANQIKDLLAGHLTKPAVAATVATPAAVEEQNLGSRFRSILGLRKS